MSTLKEQMTDGNVSENIGPYFRVVRPEMLEFVPPNATTILDVGCADGTFGSLLKEQRDVEVWGIEPNQSAANSAALKLDRVICNAFDRSLTLPAGKFDCIIFNDVLEHLVDPQDALLHCKELLKYPGAIVASIPNVRYFDNIWNLLIYKNWEYTDCGILDRTHLWFFTERSIRSAFEKVGYKIELIKGVNPLQVLHPGQVRRFRIINWLLLNKIEDMNYLQFAVVARPVQRTETNI
jgi:2-polyprenyl-3-methyl-5-hydroxy-6-metoxy-1,4-benzoquinol methylase